MNILADASLPGLKEAFPQPFRITEYQHPDELPTLLKHHEILVCRSTLKVNSRLLENHQLKYIATASSGTDHCDHSFIKSQNIQLVDAKGCNATSVADYVLSCLAYLKQRSLPVGKKVGIIGMGYVGTRVFNRLKALDFDVCAYDPLKALREIQFSQEKINSTHEILIQHNKIEAISLTDQLVQDKKIQDPGSLNCSLEDLYQCDLLCIHAALHDTDPYPSADLINHHFLQQLKPGCILINASRGGILNEKALLDFKDSFIYCTDVYSHEPAINPEIVDMATLCTPHIAGHSLEAKYSAVALVSKQLHKLANLPLPQFAQPIFQNTLSVNKNISWADQILSMYNPADETLLLKKADNKESAFISLRKNHQKRHNFDMYLTTNNSKLDAHKLTTFDHFK